MRCGLSLIALVLSAVPAAADHGNGKGKPTLFPGLGTRTHKVTTASADAQKYFDQGLTLCWAFNHPEAIRSFERAAKFDPDCAMAYWGSRSPTAATSTCRWRSGPARKLSRP